MYSICLMLHFLVTEATPMLPSSFSVQVKLYVEDPLVYHGALKAGWSVAFMNSMAEVRSLISKLTLPLFIMHGGDDHMVPLSASQFIHDNAASQDKTFQVSCESASSN